MGGIGLSRLWASNPKIAFFLHLGVTVLAAGATLVVALSGGGWGTLAVFVAFLLLAASLVFLTWAAIKNGWQPDSYDGQTGSNVPSPSVAWNNTQAAGRILWIVFALTFLSALAFLLARSPVGIALILVAFVLAVVAMRTD